MCSATRTYNFYLQNRIERYWRDVFYGYTGTMYNVFSTLENNGVLDVDNPKHVYLLHKVFIPRINSHLETFRKAWNCHPLSSERNYSPNQLRVLHSPPNFMDLELTNVSFIKIVVWLSLLFYFYLF